MRKNKELPKKEFLRQIKMPHKARKLYSLYWDQVYELKTIIIKKGWKSRGSGKIKEDEKPINFEKLKKNMLVAVKCSI